MFGKKLMQRSLVTVLVAGGTALNVGTALAAPLDLSDTPLFLTEKVPPLNMLVMGRDHKLYYEAYNDHSDLNGDGVLDLTYSPGRIDYFGYFDSYKCYDYDSGAGRFEPVGTATRHRYTIAQRRE